MKRQLATLLGLIAAALLMPGTAGAQTKDNPLVLNYADIEAAGTIRTRNVAWWIDQIEKRTDGAIKIRPYWAGSLVAGKDIPVGVSQGYPEMGSNVYVYDTSFVAALSLFDLPVAKTSVGAIRAFNDMVLNNDIIKAELAKRKLVGLTVFGHHGPSVVVTSKDVNSPANVKGLRIRAPGGIVGQILESMGAEIVTMGAGNVYSAMQRGTVDGLASSIKDIYEWKWTDYAKHMWSLGIPLGPPVVYVINEDVWNKLPAATQKIILDTSGEFLDRQIKEYEAGLSGFQQKLKDNGVTFKEIPAIADVAKKVSADGIQKWVVRMNGLGLPGQQLLDDYRQTLTKYE